MAFDRQIDYRSSALSTSHRRGGQALQRTAEMRLSGGDLFPSPPDDPDGTGYVAGAGRIVPRLGGYLFRPTIRKDDPFRCRLGAGAVRDHSRVYGNRQRLLEQPSLDDYRILQDRIGGGS